mmetsp:Transcript_90265/g.229533  ORF Transcript_90265/g.229533 Transcript_90265/m.229533 type:complete len:607 (+) Transcript_90265:119-1939(+)
MAAAGVGGYPTVVDTSRTASPHLFKGRTVAIVNDLTTEEQWYLYLKTKELREAVAAGQDLSKFRLRNPEAAVYTIFMEDSTRTKESFRNGAEFHGMKVNVFDAKTSSFQKNETITDTIKMLVGYSIGQSTFVIRSKIEGVCTWLEEAITQYCQLRGFERASFINAGDGRHEHPSQEMLDEYTFLEHKGFDRSSIHLALLGDLFHGRTVHSKVDGLKLYKKVEVDLIAPKELALPEHYEDKMVDAGFIVRRFSSIAEYLEQSKVASIWYFTRLQLERMGDQVLDKAPLLRQAVTMQREFIDKLPQGTKFFHPLPRDARYPTLPFWLDNTEFNGWDRQSQNGYFTRIVMLGMLGGLFGDDFQQLTGQPHESMGSPRGTQRQMSLPNTPDDILKSSPMKGALDFVREVAPADQKAGDSGSAEAGLMPIQRGIVIERLAEGQSEEQIWGLMYMVRSILGLHGVGGQGVHRPPDRPASGFISVPDFDLRSWGRQPLKKLAAMAPGSTLKDIADGSVRKEFRFLLPPRIYNFREIKCKNEACISHPNNGQREVDVYFVRVKAAAKQKGAGSPAAPTDPDGAWRFECKYCETPHNFYEIWDYKKYYNPSDFTI